MALRLVSVLSRLALGETTKRGYARIGSRGREELPGVGGLL